jgi:hypothetical protein
MGVARFLLATIDGGEHQAHAAAADLLFEHEAALDHRAGDQGHGRLRQLEDSHVFMRRAQLRGGVVTNGSIGAWRRERIRLSLLGVVNFCPQPRAVGFGQRGAQPGAVWLVILVFAHRLRLARRHPRR